MARKVKSHNLLSEAEQTELMMDWLEGQTYREMMTKYTRQQILCGKHRCEGPR